MTRDIFRAILVIAVVSVLRGQMPSWPPAPAVETRAPAVETVAPRPWQPAVPVAPEPPPLNQWQNQPVPPQRTGVQWQPPAVTWQPPQIVIQEETKRPLRRVAAAMTDLGDAIIGVVR